MPATAPRSAAATDEVNVSESEFWNVRAALRGGCEAGRAVMAYMPLNGVLAAGNRWLLTDVPRALKFKGSSSATPTASSASDAAFRERQGRAPSARSTRAWME
jgi:hypothetical protein